jgi:hypothetical protein
MLGLGVRMRLRGENGQDGGLNMPMGQGAISRLVTNKSCSQMCCGW